MPLAGRGVVTPRHGKFANTTPTRNARTGVPALGLSHATASSRAYSSGRDRPRHRAGARTREPDAARRAARRSRRLARPRDPGDERLASPGGTWLESCERARRPRRGRRSRAPRISRVLQLRAWCPAANRASWSSPSTTTARAPRDQAIYCPDRRVRDHRRAPMSEMDDKPAT
jgi:hypothetical protein